MSYYVILCHFRFGQIEGIVIFRKVTSGMRNPGQNIAFDKILANYDNIRAHQGPPMKENEILQSWKEISRYLYRDIRTCHRWERDFGLPIHRIDENSPRSKVFAYKSEIDQWMKERGNNSNHLDKGTWGKKGLIIGLMAGFILLSLFLGYLYFLKGTPGLLPGEPTLAVLPFENLNSSEYEEYLSEGLTNEITNSLIRLNRIKVIPAAEDGPYEHTPDNLSKIHRDLKVDYFLLGKIEKSEKDIRIIMSLVRGEDKKNIWTEEFASDLEGIFSIEEDICHKIHERLSIELDDGSLIRASSGSTKNYGAYDAYLKGNFVLNRIVEQDDDPWKLYHQGKYYLGRFTPDANEMAISLFTQATEMDNHYALAYIGLAQCYAHNVNFEWDSKIEWLDKAKALLKNAQQISPDLPEYYSTLIEINLLKQDCFDEGDLETTLNLAQEAVQKYPNHAQLNSITGFCYSARFAEKGDEADFERALEYKQRAFLLNPSGVNNVRFAELLMLKKDFYKAREVCQLIEESSSSLYSKAMLGEIYYYSGELDKSEDVFRQFEFPMNFKIYSMFFLAMIAAQKGEAESALELAQKIETIKPLDYGMYEDEFKLASIYFGMGEKELGYGHLESFFSDEHIIREKYFKLKYLEIDRNFEPVRNEERFQKIIKGE